MAAIEPKKFSVGGREFVTIPIQGFDALDLNRVVTSMWTDMHENVSRKGVDPKDKQAVGAAMADELTRCFRNMGREEYRSILEMTLSSTTLVGGANEKDTRLSDADTVGQAFAGHLADLPEVLLAVWAANRLTPFA